MYFSGPLSPHAAGEDTIPKTLNSKSGRWKLMLEVHPPLITPSFGGWSQKPPGSAETSVNLEQKILGGKGEALRSQMAIQGAGLFLSESRDLRRAGTGWVREFDLTWTWL